MVPKYLQPEVGIFSEDSRLSPERAHPSDAGADLRSNAHVTIKPGTVQLVDTGVAVKIPLGYGGLVFSRSGQGKLRVSLANSVGLIDSDYRGNIKLLIANEGSSDYNIVAYDTRIAQLVIVPILLPIFVEHDYSEPWNDTVRGEGGFGSTNTA